MLFSFAGLFFLGLLAPDLIQTIRLESGGRFISMTPERTQFCADDTIVLASQTEVFHFDLRDGRLIANFGCKGQGPNEYAKIRCAVWTGSFYLIVDSRLLQTTAVNAQGRQIWRKKDFFKSLFVQDGRLWAVSGDPIKQIQKEQPDCVFELQVTEQGYRQKGSRFHQLSEECVNLSYNYTKHYVAADVKTVFVMDELKPTVFAYDIETKRQLWITPLQLVGFAPAPGEVPKRFYKAGFSRIDFFRWKHAWSRIAGFASVSDGLFVCYELPCEKECDRPERIIAKTNSEGRFLGKIPVGNGNLVKASDGKVFVIFDWDDEVNPEPTYDVKVFRW